MSHSIAAPPPPLALLIADLERLHDDFAPVAPSDPPPAFLARAAQALGRLVSDPAWLPDGFARPHPEHYQQYLLWRDAAGRFSVVSFVWGPGQKTPIHDHQVWGLVGILRGAEYSRSYRPDPDHPEAALRASGARRLLPPGAVEQLSPAKGDIHRVENALADQPSISIHVYGADIGQVQRWVFPEAGGRKGFVSGYSNDAASPPFPPLAGAA